MGKSSLLSKLTRAGLLVCWTAIILTDEYAVRALHYPRKLPKLQETRYMSLIENISSSLHYFGESNSV